MLKVYLRDFPAHFSILNHGARKKASGVPLCASLEFENKTIVRIRVKFIEIPLISKINLCLSYSFITDYM
jgi:hypothetical protein